MFTAVAIFGASTIAFGLSRSVILSLVALFVVGASDMISVVVRSTLVQIATPPAMRGRVSAVNLLFIGASNELGQFESGVVAAWLGAHGLTAETVPVEARGDTAAQLEDVAERKGADLIVAGAYGHSRLREWVFGGVTAEMLMHPRRCVLVSH